MGQEVKIIITNYFDFPPHVIIHLLIIYKKFHVV